MWDSVHCTSLSAGPTNCHTCSAGYGVCVFCKPPLPQYSLKMLPNTSCVTPNSTQRMIRLFAMPKVSARHFNIGLEVDIASLWARKKVPCRFVQRGPPLGTHGEVLIRHTVIIFGFALQHIIVPLHDGHTKDLLVPSPVTLGCEQSTN